MSDTRLSVSWDAYQNNICSGLSLLQQRGEFVDMTLAADGHHVKVHQMVMCLVSPYIKELISSAQCPHPVIFLNNISHSTLNSILEYIYTGEVLVTREKLPDVLAAAKALHIKGLKEMDVSEPPEQEDTSDPIADVEMEPVKNTLVEKLQERKENKKHNVKIKKESPQPVCKVFVGEDDKEGSEMNTSTTHSVDKKLEDVGDIRKLDVYKGGKQNVQFSISNQGGLQIICNRYIYTLKYVQKSQLIRVWRCVDSSYRKCPANIYTNDKNEIVKRTFTHNHPFHDLKIVKKLRLGIVYKAYNEAETQAQYKKTANKDEETAPLHSQNIKTDSE